MKIPVVPHITTHELLTIDIHSQEKYRARCIRVVIQVSTLADADVSCPYGGTINGCGRFLTGRLLGFQIRHDLTLVDRSRQTRKSPYRPTVLIPRLKDLSLH
jgi:hypothetical protein